MNTNKLMKIGLSALISTSMLAGCTKKEASKTSEEQTSTVEEEALSATLKVWAPEEEAGKGSWMEKEIKAFKKAHPKWDVTIETEAVAFADVKNKLAEDSENLPDVYLYDSNDLANLIEANDIAELGCENLNTIETARGISPSSEYYVDEKDGFALVVKAGSNISRFGKILITPDSDWIEKSLYDEYVQRSEDNMENRNIVKKGDVLLASTGEGTLGKCCVYDKDIPAIADGHVTIIRVDKKIIDPYYLTDYLRCGFGEKQIACFYSGSTGLIELTPEQVDMIIIDNAGEKQDINVQKEISKAIRRREKKYITQIEEAKELLETVDKIWD